MTKMVKYMALLLFLALNTGCLGQTGSEPAAPGSSKELSGKMAELKARLTPLQYHVTMENGTERPFNNEYWDNKKPGIYVDLISGEALFSSTDKFVSGTGWPSYIRPLEENNIVEVKDLSHGMIRIEVRSRKGDAHLGHLFNDGPPPTGLRYCINSAALRFIPVENLEKEGYEEYLRLFDR